MTEMTGRRPGEKYLLLRLIGKGGTGVVYEAEHLVLGRRVAVKILRSTFQQMPEAS